MSPLVVFDRDFSGFFRILEGFWGDPLGSFGIFQDFWDFGGILQDLDGIFQGISPLVVFAWDSPGFFEILMGFFRIMKGFWRDRLGFLGFHGILVDFFERFFTFFEFWWDFSGFLRVLVGFFGIPAGFFNVSHLRQSSSGILRDPGENTGFFRVLQHP